MDKLIVIVGPTAVGKTALSLALAQAVDGEIVSGDSMQIYRQLNIGTAKATPAEQAQAPHHMIDIAEPTETYSAARFVQEAQQAIAEITARGKVPILVGGTGFYVQALLGDKPLAAVDDIQDDAFTEKWTQIAHDEGEVVLRDALRKVDAVSEARILPGQIRRLVRALLVSDHTGKPFSEQKPEPQRLYDAFIIGLTTDRQVLYERINQRVDAMMTQGILAEAEIAMALPADSTARKAIGYKELFGYLTGDESLEQATETLKQASRRYAKRQMTWFNNQFTDIHWFDLVQQPSEITDIKEAVKRFMSE
ncbi:tRNA (adenosine(37)-N6)-dimethylallyltransferase MiaA [Weissella cibaria]|uniref:tRNA (adenosine(37)-N6)-dimethylallyltransferase MiaA n=1 Tax=Weissella cibaria TaxID=137591 RepID=UPI0007062336|nr:tRNA (adenosine(37)-N6)-dimethylallyltransferase MiaA [Weissella cibaria]ALI32761.1 tRNA dimethylallyltransferase [Weissella cibaria]MCG4286687.1 tRNA (adenosine(37)-N6)-dimethylallyltransferase MiaA [Weissella cibaria]MDY2519308.1 tRNA (adenosine(37)-N6)-dimethylallyltransferase MiaA [Weissella cibaria]WCE24556.1 tRNA (adenosine(37)-N6)-dimethylallyltransferase MiaA [Weissella cibaria]WCE26744.1 tRNA (adenosine(37)-N6)-dimethylallyltransferase MiaA [Weissella cibaria]